MKFDLKNKVATGFGVALALIIGIGVVSWRSTVQLTADADRVKHTQEVQTRLAALLSTMTDVETGMRGYVITGDEKFLEPYVAALTRADAEFRQLRALTSDNPQQQQRLDSLSPLITARLQGAKDGIELRRAQGFAAAQAEIATGKGKQLHDAIRAVIAELERAESQLMSIREERSRSAARFTQTTIVASGATAFLFLGAALFFIRRDFTARQQMESLRLSEEQLRLFVDHSPAAIAMFDRDMRYRVVSRRWLSDYHLGEQSLIGRCHYEVFPDLPERRTAIHRRCLAGAVESCDDDPFPRTDGTIDWVRWEIHPWRDGNGDIGGIIEFSEVVTARKQADAVIACQQQVLEKIATGAPLTETLDTLLRHLEAFAPKMLCSVLLLDADGQRVQVSMAPSLPEAFNRAIEGLPIGPRAGSCGTAAFRREPVFVEDIATDPLWTDYCELALAHGLRACWSSPIFDEQQRVLGTFAIYYREPCRPGPQHLRCIELATHLAAVAINRQRAMTALQRQHLLVSAVVEGTSDAIFAKDLAGRYLVINSAGAQALGKTANEVIGLTDEELLPSEVARRFRQTDEEVIASGQRVMQEEQAVLPGGTRYFLANKTPWLDAAGAPVGVIGVSRDITERKLAEAALLASEVRYRRLFEAAKDGILILDADTGMVVDVNPFLIELLGFSHETFLGKKVWELGFFKDIIANEANFAELQVKEYIRYEDMALETHDGRRIEVEFISNAYRVNADKVIQCNIRDDTERKRAEQKLAESSDQLRALLARLQRTREDERTRVAREIHDELGQLLTALKMDVRWLEKKLSEPGVPPAFNPLLDRAVAASELADTTISAVQKIALQLRPGTLDRLGLAAALTEEARRFQERAGVQCAVTVAELRPPLRPDIADELFYICQEALTNVARHAHAKNATIELRTEGDNLLLEVRDDGVGLDETELREPHSLGLIGMRERAMQCDGTISFSRNEPCGTRVTVRVPKAAAAVGGGPIT